MKKFTLPTTILVASLILGGFYYTSQLNKQKYIEKQQILVSEAKQEKEKIELDFNCFRGGQDFFFYEPSFQDFKKKFGDSKVWATPEYHFNTRLQTCLMSWEATSDVIGVEFKYGGVIDVISNKTILKSDSNPMNYDSYTPERDVLMSE